MKWRRTSLVHMVINVDFLFSGHIANAFFQLEQWSANIDFQNCSPNVCLGDLTWTSSYSIGTSKVQSSPNKFEGQKIIQEELLIIWNSHYCWINKQEIDGQSFQGSCSRDTEWTPTATASNDSSQELPSPYWNGLLKVPSDPKLQRGKRRSCRSHVLFIVSLSLWRGPTSKRRILTNSTELDTICAWENLKRSQSVNMIHPRCVHL